MNAILLACSSAFALSALAGAQPDVLGVAPRNLNRPLSAVPNEEAIVQRIWVPGLDQGFIPQGVAVAGDRVLLSGYHYDAKTKRSGPPCHVYVVDPEDGQVLSRIAVPRDVKHAGGVAWARGAMWVVDVGILYKLDLRGKVLGRAKVDPVMGPSFVSEWGNKLWVGLFVWPYEKKSPRAYLIDPEAAIRKKKLGPRDALASIPIPKSVQGIAQNERGVWLARSHSTLGELQLVDPRSGALLETYPLFPGVEDLGFAADGLLWTASEAGSLRWRKWKTNFPVLFALDPEKLQSE